LPQDGILPRCNRCIKVDSPPVCGAEYSVAPIRLRFRHVIVIAIRIAFVIESFCAADYDRDYERDYEHDYDVPISNRIYATDHLVGRPWMPKALTALGTRGRGAVFPERGAYTCMRASCGYASLSGNAGDPYRVPRVGAPHGCRANPGL
jgi:hypothetical protein